MLLYSVKGRLVAGLQNMAYERESGSETLKQGRDVSAIMRKVHSTNTTPEVRFREALVERGLVIEEVPSLPGKPDVVFSAKRVAIFIDGDFWHGAQWRQRGLTSLEEQFNETKSKAYWLKKIRRNMQRDCAVTAALLTEGWVTLRLWERDIQKDLEGCLAMTLEVVEKPVSPSLEAQLPQKTVAEFFAGIGLMRMGLEYEGWSVEFANDIDPQKQAMYEGHFGQDERFVCDDIHRVPAQRVPTVTLATASFPCTDLSLAGAREGLAGKQSSSFWGFIAILEGMRERKPPLVLLENVPDFVSSHKGKDFEAALRALNTLGYCVDAFILDAAWFVPQSRRRLFIIGAQEELYRGEAQNILQAAVESDIRPAALIDFIKRHPDINWLIRSLPSPRQASPPLTSILDDLSDDASEWWAPGRAEYLLNQMSPRHRAIAERMIAGDEWSYGTVFRRMRKGRSMAELRSDGIAGCLRTPKGGSAKQILFKAGNGRYFARHITPREAARLMGAGEFQISGELDQALFGFGDAVCVPAVTWIATYYLNPMINELIRSRPLALSLREVMR